MQGRYVKPSAVSEGQAQQSFIDEREELPPLVADDDSDEEVAPRPKRKKKSSGSGITVIEELPPVPEEPEAPRDE